MKFSSNLNSYINLTIRILDIIPHSDTRLKHNVSRRLDSVSVFKWNLLSLAQYKEPVSVSGRRHVMSG
jgi:hypothetical protein